MLLSGALQGSEGMKVGGGIAVKEGEVHTNTYTHVQNKHSWAKQESKQTITWQQLPLQGWKLEAAMQDLRQEY